MGLTKEQKREYQRDYMRQRRSNKGLTKSGSNKEGLTRYPAIVEALADPDKRKRLERICEELGKRGLQREVRYGLNGPTFDVVGELLEVTCH